MAIRGRLGFIGYKKEFTVVECEYEFNQTTDADGTPNDGIYGGKIVVTIVTPPENLYLYHWMFTPWSLKNGYVEFITNANSNNWQEHTIMFENAKCVNLYEYFNNQSKHMMTTRLTIQCRTIGFKGINESGLSYDFRHQKKDDIMQGGKLDYNPPDPAGELGERMMQQMNPDVKF